MILYSGLRDYIKQHSAFYHKPHLHSTCVATQCACVNIQEYMFLYTGLHVSSLKEELKHVSCLQLEL